MGVFLINLRKLKKWLLLQTNIPIFRMVHIDNIPHIIKYGITHKNSINSNPNYRAIGASDIISRRSTKVCPKGHTLDDYIPFYFCYRSPMLYAIQNQYGNTAPTPTEDIIYIIVRLPQIMGSTLSYLFTDAHAISSFSRFYDASDINNIDKKLNWKAIKNPSWGGEENSFLRLKKQAEFLVYGDIPYHLIAGFVVYNPKSKERLTNFGVAEAQIAVRPHYYF